VDTLTTLAALLRFFGRAEIRFGILRFYPGRGDVGHDVAMLNPSKAVVICPVYAGETMVQPARNMRKDETAEDVAREILARSIRAAA
jgi:hypothetical protein